MYEADIDGVAAESFNAALFKVKWINAHPAILKQVQSIYPIGRNFKSRKSKTAMRNLTWNLLGQRSGRLIKMKTDRPGSSGLTPVGTRGTKAMCTCVGKMVLGVCGRKDNNMHGGLNNTGPRDRKGL